jgi:protein-tyrosine-phosphatase
MAEGIARKLLSDADYSISSAGTSALEGLPASSLAVNVARSNSVDIADHRSNLLGSALVREADLIIIMAAKHRDTVGVIDPEALQYTYLLTDFSDDVKGDILDPIGLDEKGYEETFSTIEKCVVGLKDKLGSFDGWKKK